MKILNRTLTALVLLGALGLLASCGSTWEGVKKDTSVNMEKTGNAISNAGKSIKTD